MKKYKNADSFVQRKAEKELFKQFVTNKKEKYNYNDNDIEQNKRIWLNDDDDDNNYIEPDIYSKKYGIVGEIHTHLGALKSAQAHKVAADILKMLVVEKFYGKELTKYIVVCSEEEKKQLTESKSHLAFTIKYYGIKVEYYPLSAELQQELEETVKKQDLYGKEAIDA